MSSNNRELPEEVVVEILLRLPVKTLVRCKTLSKHHHSLIRSRSFVYRHLQLITTTPRNTPVDVDHHVLAFHKNNFKESPESTYNESLSLLSRRSGLTTPLDWLPRFTLDRLRGGILVDSLLLFGPVNGIYALALQECYSRILSDIILWNPATREHHELPSSPLDRLGFPQTDYFFACGLGFDNSTNYYKVLLLPSKKGIASPYLYGLQHGGWKEIGSDDVVFGYDSKILGRDGVYLHGACHWVCVVVSKANNTLFILKFDMCEEVFESYPFPGVLQLPEPNNNNNGCATMILQGYLGLVNVQDNDEGGRSTCFDVWVMKEYGVVESWEILYRVSLPSGAIARFLGIVEDRFYVREEGEGWLVSYDIQDSSKEEQRYSVVDDTIERVLPYVETISRIEYESKKGDEEDQKKREEFESELHKWFNDDFLKGDDVSKMVSMFSSSDLDG